MMKQLFIICTICILVLFETRAEESRTFRVGTENIDVIFQVGENGRLYQSYIGPRLKYPADYPNLPLGKEAYLTHGLEDYFEPAIRLLHNDGNPSLLLKFISSSVQQEGNKCRTTFILRDDKYPVEVKLLTKHTTGKTSSRHGAKYRIRRKNRLFYITTPPRCCISTPAILAD